MGNPEETEAIGRVENALMMPWRAKETQPVAFNYNYPPSTVFPFASSVDDLDGLMRILKRIDRLAK